MKLETFLQKPKAKVLWIVFLSTFVLYFVFQYLIFGPLLAKFPDGYGLMAVKNAWTKERMDEIINRWKKESPDLLEIMIVAHYYDLVFMAVYGLLLWSGLLLVTRNLAQRKGLQKVYLYSSTLPWVAVGLDLVEEVNLFIMFFDPYNINELNVIGANISALICLIVIGVCIVLILVGFIIALLSHGKKK